MILTSISVSGVTLYYLASPYLVSPHPEVTRMVEEHIRERSPASKVSILLLGIEGHYFAVNFGTFQDIFTIKTSEILSAWDPKVYCSTVVLQIHSTAAQHCRITYI